MSVKLNKLSCVHACLDIGCICMYLYVVPTPSVLMLTSSNGNRDTVVVGSAVTLTCTVVLNSAIMESENTRSLLMVDVQLSRDGTPLVLPDLTVSNTTFIYSTQLKPFRRTDSGNYTCTATVRPHTSSTYLTGNEMLSSRINIKAGKYYRHSYYNFFCASDFITVSAPPLNV